MGTLYLLHFDPPYKHARHYLGWTGNAQARFERHLAGQGSPLVKAAVKAGCDVKLAKVWPGSRDDERRIKKSGSSTRVCPLCKDDYNARRRERRRNGGPKMTNDLTPMEDRLIVLCNERYGDCQVMAGRTDETRRIIGVDDDDETRARFIFKDGHLVGAWDPDYLLDRVKV